MPFLLMVTCLVVLWHFLPWWAFWPILFMYFAWAED